MNVEIYRREDELYDWRLVADNGDIIATSGGQGYTERNDCFEGLTRVARAFRGGVASAGRVKDLPV